MDKREIKERKKRIKRAREEALEILESPAFFNLIIEATKREGLVGEERNALALYIGATSRLRPRPLNTIIKGESSSGKNFQASCVFQLFPKRDIVEISSTSEQAWNYAEDEFRHKVLYLVERNEASGGVHPARFFISEGKLIRTVTERVGRSFGKVTHIARGPIAFVSTTTKDRIEVDDETRNVSVRTDSSEEQTKRIVQSYAAERKRLSRAEIRAWRQVQHLVRERVKVPIRLPAWFQAVAEQTYSGDVRVRRYFPAFVEACKTVCLLRSFQRFTSKHLARSIELDFCDFAITSIIFDSVFTESLHGVSDRGFETMQALERIVAVNRGKPVHASQLAKYLGISKDRAYGNLRGAAAKGLIRRVNPSERSNRKLFLPAPRQRFVPDPQKLFENTRQIPGPVRFRHPLTGKLVSYSRSNGNTLKS